MRTLIIVSITAAGLALGACSKEDRADVGEGAAAARSEVKEATHEIATDPEVKEVGAAIGDAGVAAADAVKDTAGRVQEGMADVSADVGRQASEQRSASGDSSRK